MNVFFTGFVFYLALAAQLGPQNVFLLRQGILRQQNLLVVGTSILADTILILLGTFGFGKVLTLFPSAMIFTKAAGAAFLLWYSYGAACRALRPHKTKASSDDDNLSSGRIILTALAFSWFNPSTLFDLVVLLGTVAAAYHVEDVSLFAAGAIAASIVWLTTIVIAGRIIAPLFNNPRTWVVLDILVAIIMLILAITILAN